MTENVCAARFMDPYRYTTCKGEKIFDWKNNFDNTFRWKMLEPWVREVSSSTAAEELGVSQ